MIKPGSSSAISPLVCIPTRSKGNAPGSLIVVDVVVVIGGAVVVVIGGAVVLEVEVEVFELFVEGVGDVGAVVAAVLS